MFATRIAEEESPYKRVKLNYLFPFDEVRDAYGLSKALAALVQRVKGTHLKTGETLAKPVNG
jgi:hypothetical protein